MEINSYIDATLLDTKATLKDIKELCMQQDIIWNNTPFHRQTKEAIEVLCHALPPEDLADIFTIKNAYGISINEILRN